MSVWQGQSQNLHNNLPTRKVDNGKGVVRFGVQKQNWGQMSDIFFWKYYFFKKSYLIVLSVSHVHFVRYSMEGMRGYPQEV